MTKLIERNTTIHTKKGYAGTQPSVLIQVSPDVNLSAPSGASQIVVTFVSPSADQESAHAWTLAEGEEGGRVAFL